MKATGATIPERMIRNFKGLVTRVENYSIPDGAASECLNWQNLGDHIELRRGRAILGQNDETAGKISGLIVSTKFNGTQVVHRARGTHIEYYDTSSELWVETTITDIIPAAASGEDFAFDQYHSLAGAFVYGSSKNSGVYKIPSANPGSVVNQNSTSFRGKIRIKQARTFLWDRKDTNGGFDQTGLYGSYIDKDELSDFTQTTGETGFTGAVDSANKIYSKASLAQVTGVKTCMYIVIAATTGVGTETFIDDRSGNLSSNYGGTGTIDYATGAVSITFVNAPTAGSVTASYYTEDATSGGIFDFTKSTPRVAGQGFVFRQDDGGSDLQNVLTIGDVEFSVHTNKTWRVTLTSDDTSATNLIYRAKVGIPNWRAACETGDGIYYIDAVDGSEPKFRILKPGFNNPEILPESISDNLILSPYNFDDGVVFEWGVYICFFGKTIGETANNRLFMYHTIWKSFEVHDFRASVSQILNGALIIGDSASQNTFTCFSGLTDEDVEIDNNWTSGNHDWKMAGTKYHNIFRLKGLIQDDQEIEVFHSYDNGEFVSVGTISGQGAYVDHNQRVNVGSTTLGSTEVGGGGDGIEASPYEREWRVNTPVYERVRVRFRANKVGFASVSEYGPKDIRSKSRAGARQYVVN